MSRVIMNLGEIAKSAMLLALRTMFKFEPNEPPIVEMNIVTKPRIVASPDSFASLIRLSHKHLGASGFIVLLMPKAQGKKLLQDIGLKKISSEDIKDFTGEFCNIIAGTFKTEVIRLGMGVMEIGLPKIYSEGVDQTIDYVNVDTKYTITIVHDDQNIMTLEVAFQSYSDD